MKRAVTLAGALCLLWGVALVVVEWRLSQIDAQAVTQASAQWRAQLAPLWPAAGSGAQAAPPSLRNAADAAVTWGGAPTWRLWPSPRVVLHEVKWPVPTEVSSDGWVLIQRLTLRAGWRALWQTTPPLQGVAAEGVSWRVQDGGAGLLSRWDLQHLDLGAPDREGVQPLVADVSVRVEPWSTTLPGDAPAWAQGRGHLRAFWVPAQGDVPAHWRQVDLRFEGRLGEWPVTQGHLTLGHWQHAPQQRRLQWADLVLSARLGEPGAQGDMALRAPALLLTEQGASGQPVTGAWTTARPWPATWQLDSGMPRGRYGEVHWPQWRLALIGQQGTRAAGLLQADFVWLGRTQGVRWDALVGQWSVQPQGQAERQWAWRGQARWSPQAADWRFEGQALGDTASALRWDGPFSLQGHWQRWPRSRTQIQWRVATVLMDGAALHDVPAAALAQWPTHLWPDDLSLQVGYLGLGALRLSHVQARLEHRASEWRVPEFTARLWDGQIRGEGSWHARSREWQLQGRLDRADLALARATWANDLTFGSEALQAASGRWNAQWQWKGLGASLTQVSGRTTVDVGPGHWSGVSLRQVLGAGVATSDRARTDWRRLRLQGDVHNGVWDLGLELQSPGWRARAHGGLDLAQREVSLQWSRPTGGKPLTLAGPWHSLQWRSD